MLQLWNLLVYCPFPPPGIAACSLPDTISALPRSQRLTPFRVAFLPALLIVILKSFALRTNDGHFTRADRFWAKIFGINFALGVVTGIPTEFQFGTNWAEFSKATGGVTGRTLAMEGLFSFFQESTSLGLFLCGEKKLGRVGQWWAAFFVFRRAYFPDPCFNATTYRNSTPNPPGNPGTCNSIVSREPLC